MTIYYDPHRASAFLHQQMEGHNLSIARNPPDVLVLIAVHCFLLYLDGHLLEDGGDGLPTLDWQASTVAMGLLTFFLVFYGNHCYSRYFELYSHCISIQRQMMQWAHLVHVHFGGKTAAAKWNMARLMLGAMQLHYAFMRREEDDERAQGVSTEVASNAAIKSLFAR